MRRRVVAAVSAAVWRRNFDQLSVALATVFAASFVIRHSSFDIRHSLHSSIRLSSIVAQEARFVAVQFGLEAFEESVSLDVVEHVRLPKEHYVSIVCINLFVNVLI
jgi:hypothetical protein